MSLGSSLDGDAAQYGLGRKQERLALAMKLHPALVAGLLLTLTPVWQLGAQEPHMAPSAPPDKPVGAATTAEQQRIEAAIAPYIAQARATYPEARDRFLAGLPPRHSFFVTVPLTDGAGRRETVFLAVDSLTRDSVYGRIWNQIHVVQGYRLGDRYSTAEAELLDWLITRPDGTEEGNFVGKFLDTYRP
jgi:hypothetical protein